MAEATSTTDWAHAAALGVIADLSDRHTIKRGFEGLDAEVRAEIVGSLATIIRDARAAQIPPDDIPPEHLKIETWPPRAGGQQVGLTATGIRIKHLPTGLVAICDVGRSQHRNRAVAMDMILGGLTSPNLR